MIEDAMGELFGPLASIPNEDATPRPRYEDEAQAIIAGLQRVATRLLQLEEASKP